MEAFKLKESIIRLLSDYAQGRYEVSGLKNRKTDAADLLRLPQVLVLYKQGNFPKNNSSINGPYQHEGTIAVIICAAAESEMDLSVLEGDADREEIVVALAAKQDAEVIADRLLDETAGLIFDIIMRPQNAQAGMGYDPDRWITELVKHEASQTGDLVVAAASFTMTFRVPEYTTEEEGRPGTCIHHSLDLTADTEGEFAEGEAVRVMKPA